MPLSLSSESYRLESLSSTSCETSRSVNNVFSSYWFPIFYQAIGPWTCKLIYRESRRNLYTPVKRTSGLIGEDSQATVSSASLYPSTDFKIRDQGCRGKVPDAKNPLFFRHGPGDLPLSLPFLDVLPFVGRGFALAEPYLKLRPPLPEEHLKGNNRRSRGLKLMN
jgi:hypothetical protein